MHAAAVIAQSRFGCRLILKVFALVLQSIRGFNEALYTRTGQNFVSQLEYTFWKFAGKVSNLEDISFLSALCAYNYLV